MKPEIAKKWVKALRSGKYKQAQGSLRDGDAYCCLGVLCDLYDQSLWKLDEEKGFVYAASETSTASEILPSVVREWAGLDSPVGRFSKPIEDFRYSLATINDDDDADFEYIAGVIEKYVDAL